MRERGSRIRRVLAKASARTARLNERLDAPRRVRQCVIDFSSLPLPADVRLALADAFWSHFSSRSPLQIVTLWAHVRVFVRFAVECGLPRNLADVQYSLLARYIEWLNRQRRRTGEGWSKAARASTYTTLRMLLQWLVRCRPGTLGELHFPFNPFPYRNRDSGRVRRLPARDLRAILRACERDIATLRSLRDRAERERAAAGEECHPLGSFGGLLNTIDQRYGGIVPEHLAISRAGHHAFRRALSAHGGTKEVEPYLYPRAESLLPYYLAILIHTAGNPQPIAELSCDCLQPVPLLDDREILTWTKRRAGTTQRRSFRARDPLEPPALVREILQWTSRLRPHAPAGLRERLLLFKGARGVSAWSTGVAKHIIRRDFIHRHGLPHFSLASIRPSVLSALYRASGDLREVRAVANHQQIGTTVRYVEGPQVEAEHRVRIAALQSAFLGHVSRPSGAGDSGRAASPASAGVPPAVPPGPAVSMFGFDCKDPLAGIAPGSRAGELCSNFLGCFTCPNAVITGDTASLARLSQARDHLRSSAAYIHPARWEAIYAPLLQILEEDILTRFGASELAAAAQRASTLPPLPQLR
jgi:hypothetical protein